MENLTGTLIELKWSGPLQLKSYNLLCKMVKYIKIQEPNKSKLKVLLIFLISTNTLHTYNYD